ncbi:MAG: hypothetical protein WC665_09925 [Sulfurimonas sp.]|jgi:hypothetical protein
MKKGIFLLASISMLMLAGCGESSSGATTTSSGGTNNTGTTPTTPTVKVDNGNVSNTTTANGLGVSLNPSLGVPPRLPN